jgi:hypothetical protein
LFRVYLSRSKIHLISHLVSFREIGNPIRSANALRSPDSAITRHIQSSGTAVKSRGVDPDCHDPDCHDPDPNPNPSKEKTCYSKVLKKIKNRKNSRNCYKKNLTSVADPESQAAASFW